MDYILEEQEHTREHFDLETILALEREHDLQVIRHEDWQYCCHIDRKVYAVSLTFSGALVDGVRRYLESLAGME